MAYCNQLPTQKSIKKDKVPGQHKQLTEANKLIKTS